VQAGAAVPDKQPKNTAAYIPTPKLPPVGAGKAVPAFPSPSAKGSVNSGKGAPSVAQTSPASPPAAGSSQVIHIVLQLLLCNALHGDYCTAEVVCCTLPMCWTRLLTKVYTTCPCMTYKEHHMQFVLSSCHHLNMMCRICV